MKPPLLIHFLDLAYSWEPVGSHWPARALKFNAASARGGRPPKLPPISLTSSPLPEVRDIFTHFCQIVYDVHEKIVDVKSASYAQGQVWPHLGKRRWPPNGPGRPPEDPLKGFLWLGRGALEGALRPPHSQLIIYRVWGAIGPGTS